MTLPSRSVKNAVINGDAAKFVPSIISIPGLSPEDTALVPPGRLTCTAGKGVDAGNAPVVNVKSSELPLPAAHETCARIWYVVEARIPATWIEIFCRFPGTGYDAVFLP